MAGNNIKKVESEIDRLLLKVSNNEKEIAELKKQKEMMHELNLLGTRRSLHKTG